MENNMEFDTTDFNAEEIAKVNKLIESIKKEKSNTKWWIMPNFNFDEEYTPSIGHNYFVEEQKDLYSRSRPPLKSDFNSKEEAEKWLKNYLKEENLFRSAITELGNLVCNLGIIKDKLNNHKLIYEDDWDNCFRRFNESRENGELAEVTK